MIVMENENIFIQKESYQPTFRTYTGDDELKKITKANCFNSARYYVIGDNHLSSKKFPYWF